MTDVVVQQIAEAIWDALEEQADRFGHVDREQGVVDSAVDRAAVAGLVAARLNLHEERRTNAMSSGGMTTDARTGITIAHLDIRYDRRWVSDWTVEGSQE